MVLGGQTGYYDRTCVLQFTGRFLLDVILLCEGEVGTKDLLPVIGSLKHMQAWQSAQMTIITEHSAG